MFAFFTNWWNSLCAPAKLYAGLQLLTIAIILVLALVGSTLLSDGLKKLKITMTVMEFALLVAAVGLGMTWLWSKLINWVCKQNETVAWVLVVAPMVLPALGLGHYGQESVYMQAAVPSACLAGLCGKK